MRTVPSFISLLVLVMSLFMVSCEPNTNAIEIEALSQTPSDEIHLSEKQFKAAGMVLGNIETHSLAGGIQTNGRVDLPAESKASVSVYYGGYVKNIQLIAGTYVKAGDVLFTLENPDYIKMQQDFLEAKSLLSYLKSDFERQKELATDNITSQKNFLKAESDYHVTLARYESLRKQLQLMHINTDNLDAQHIQTTTPVTAPISGYIVEVAAERGKYLNPSDIAVRINDTRHLHLELHIFEDQIALVREHQKIHFHLQSRPEVEYTGEVHLINKYLNPETRTAIVHGHVANNTPPEVLVPGMYVEATIITDTTSVPSLPEEAIVSEENNHYILQLTAQEKDSLTFKKIPVETGLHTGNRIEIKSATPLETGKLYLVKGAFDLL